MKSSLIAIECIVVPFVERPYKNIIDLVRYNLQTSTIKLTCSSPMEKYSYGFAILGRRKSKTNNFDRARNVISVFFSVISSDDDRILQETKFSNLIGVTCSHLIYRVLYNVTCACLCTWVRACVCVSMSFYTFEENNFMHAIIGATSIG